VRCGSGIEVRTLDTSSARRRAPPRMPKLPAPRPPAQSQSPRPPHPSPKPENQTANTMQIFSQPERRRFSDGTSQSIRWVAHLHDLL
jgi:hypothetical protein